jgi:alpha-mannosidase
MKVDTMMIKNSIWEVTPNRRMIPKVVGLLGWVIGALCTAAQPAPMHEKVLYTVANSHLDTQWNWTIQSTIYPYVSNTLAGNFAYFEKYPDYTFNFEGAFRYRLAKEYYPELYERLKQYVAAGRWRVAGSVVDAGDVVVPSPESLFRHALYGNNFFAQEFGKRSVDIFLPDCFGFPYSLPSIAAHSGLKGFSTAKLLWGSAIPYPFQNIGRWIGPDGASVIAVIQPEAYDSGIAENLATSPKYLDRIDRMAAATGLSLDFRYFGTGDIGGAPKESYVEWLQKSINTTNGPIRVLSAGADQMFQDLTEAQVRKLPTYQGELLMRIHGVGCYTAHSEMKTYNRRNELWGDAAERAATIAAWLHGAGTYPQEKLTKAWERFLWHQFHDDLTGTSIDEAYNFSWNDELLSLQDFATEQTHGVQALAQALDTTSTGVPLVVFNALACEREDIVETVVNFPGKVPPNVQVVDAQGKAVPAQIGSARGNELPVTFLARVPANGAAVFDVRPAPKAAKLKTGLSISTSHLENARYRVQLDRNGDVSSIFDKAHQRELLRAPIRWAFLPNLSVAWPAWEITYASLTGKPTFLEGPAQVELLESGPARVTLAVTRFKDGSAFTEHISLASGAAGDRVDWDVAVNWHTRKALLKVEFPLAVSNPKATFDLGLGTIERGNVNPSRYEVPAQQWADLTDAGGAYGVSIMNDSKYGWDKPNDHTLRLTMFHTPETGSSYPHGGENSIGSHRLRFAVLGHARDWRAGQSPWAAARVNQPLQAFQTTAHPGPLGKSFSFLTCNNSNVMIKAIKKAEHSDEVVVRLQELTGQPQVAELSFAAPIKAARDLTATEQLIGSLAPTAGKLKVTLTGYQPKTMAFSLGTPAKLLPKLQSQPVDLPFNLDVFTTDANRADGDFEAGLTYPAELLPTNLVRGGVTFRPGPTKDGALNAVACRGQTIPLNAGHHTQLYFLAAAASADTAGTFKVDGKATEVRVQHFTGFIGQWNPPLLKPDEVGWVFTHRHTRTANDPYRFCYWFKYRLDLPPGAKSLTLPDVPGIRLFAMSLAGNGAPALTPAGGPLGANEIPWANAGEDLRVNCDFDGKAHVTLDASTSADPDGSIVDYVWSENGITLATGVRAELAFGVGSHSILLTVTDDQGSVSKDRVNVTVQAPLPMTLTATPVSGRTAPLTVQFALQAGASGSDGFGNTVAGQTGIITAQSENAPLETAAKLFDGQVRTKWLDRVSAGQQSGASWVQYQYASGQQVPLTGYALISANDVPARDPMNWRLLGSNDGGTNWTTLDTQTNVVFADRFERREFRLAAPPRFNLYRLQVDRSADPAASSSIQLAELELLGTLPYAYAWNFGDGNYSSAPNPQHTFAHEGNYLVTATSTRGHRNAINRQIITVGPPLTIQAEIAQQQGAVVQFTSQVTGGNATRLPFDTMRAGSGNLRARGQNAPQEGVAQLLDRNPTTKWLDFTPDPLRRSTWLEYAYAGGWTHVLTSYALTSADDAPPRDPMDWELLGSNDGGASWVVVDARRGEMFKNRLERKEFPLAPEAGFNRYRLRINSVAGPASAGCAQLAELELIGRPAVRYTWSFGDGETSSLPAPKHTYARKGNYVVSVVASDGLTSATNNLRVTIRR